MHHDSVLRAEVMTLLNPKPGERVCDATIGLGGHSETFLRAIASSGHLLGLDADSDNLAFAQGRLEQYRNRVRLLHANFRDLAAVCEDPFDIVFADLGLSSPHLDDPARGFSFRNDGPLDLRFDRLHGEPASQWISRVGEREIGRALHEFGEVRGAGRLALAIDQAKPQTTIALKNIVEKAYGWRAASVLPQVFQALRMAVNDELGALKTLLSVGPSLLKPGGRFGIITFHSLEDRLVKQAFRSLTLPSIDDQTGQIVTLAPFVLLTRKPIIPSEHEISANPRARSAKLRGLARRN